MSAVRAKSPVPVPRVFAHDATGESGVGAAFMLLEFVPGDTAMDSFVDGRLTKAKRLLSSRTSSMQRSLRFNWRWHRYASPKIGAIVLRDGEFDAWANTAKFFYKEATIRKRTPPDLVDEVLATISSFPSKVRELAGRFQFHNGPPPLIYTDLYSSNVIIDTDYNVLSVIDWENAFVGPWELVEFNKMLSMVPPEMDGPLFQ
ncbi:hypothetical protein N657DRAFT_680810 [Parathielavia appendiculata]|uniref:Aminoglycoside phosphotransferase domain-containing protein n=1 Tax=Parathielavia appendiculata TaxID=2587402 RepID=A0AAN6Z4B8_9PEZI|nr:hypothetical protein N657DRAFT_680810 [Parathielavia appendiculata]